jgi:hypothetical protein
MTETPTLPSVEELDATFGKLMDADDELGGVVTRVLKVANHEGEQEVTWEQIGSIATFADNVRLMGDRLTEVARQLAATAVRDLEPILREGRQINVPRFDEDGRQNYLDNGLMARHVEETYFLKAPRA